MARLREPARLERNQQVMVSLDDTADNGIDLRTLVVETIGAGQSSRFTGRIPQVTVEVGLSP